MNIWYQAPAVHWEEALPVGNGRIGGMVFGGARNERIALNEDTLWSGVPGEKSPRDRRTSVEAARRLFESGDTPGAERELETGALGAFTSSYMPLGDLLLTMPDDGTPVTYDRRALTLDTGVAETRFSAGGVTYTRAVFVCVREEMMLVRLSADAPGAVNLTVRAQCPLRSDVCAQGDTLTLRAQCPSVCEPPYKNSDNPIMYDDAPEMRGVRACMCVRAIARGADVSGEDGALCVRGADEVWLALSVRTSFAGCDKHPFLEGLEYEKRAARDVSGLTAASCALALSRHVAEHRAVFNRSRLVLGGAHRDDLPTDERLRLHEQGGEDAGLYETLYAYGRYLLMACSRPGTRAANLQGIWNEHMRAPWSSNYTVNINTQMNYWPAEICALSDMHEPLFDLIDAMRTHGADTARSLFGARGSMAGHNTDVWAHTSPVGEGRPGAAQWGWWTLSFAWLTAHLFARYVHTGDTRFLYARALPNLRAASQFLLDTLRPDGQGRLRLDLSTSPENAYAAPEGVAHLADHTAMGQTIVRETLENYVRALEILGLDEPDLQPARDALKRLLPLQIGADGRLLEWDGERAEVEPGHRHISHLYGLFPGHSISERAPEFMRACQQSLCTRGDEGTGWSLAWKINAWARLSDGTHALKLLRRQLRPVSPGNERGVGGTYPNLMDAHPPFQIDGNFGASSGIAAMFLRVSENEMVIAPALPPEWPECDMIGLCGANGCVADITVRGGAPRRVVLRAPGGMPRDTLVRFWGQTRTVRLSAGESLTLEAD